MKEDPEYDFIVETFNFDCKELYESILQYLSGNDILNLSLVSKFLYFFIAQSPTALNKIKFCIDEKSHKWLTHELVKNSSRQYHHLEIRGIFFNTDVVARFIEKNAQSLKTIRTSYDIKLKSCTVLPSLQSLSFVLLNLDNPISIHSTGLTLKTQNLSEMVLQGKVKNAQFLVRSLQSNSHLKKLVLENNVCEEVFFSMCHLYNFKLTTFHCNTQSQEQQSFWTHLSQFLQTQADSLREIKINCSYKMLSRFLNLLPKLRKVSYSPLPSGALAGRYTDLNFAVHVSIEEACLIFVPDNVLERFVKLTPNIKTIYIAELTVNAFNIVINNLPKLHLLKYAYVREEPPVSHSKFVEFSRQYLKSFEIIRI